MSPAARLLLAVALLVVLGQRLAVPLGGSAQLPLALVVGVPLLIAGVARGVLTWDRALLRLYAVAMAGALAVTVLALATGAPVSLLSVGYLVVLYLPWALRAPALPAADRRRVLDVLVNAMAVMAVVGLGQWLVQQRGAPFQDYLATVVPERFLLAGYNTSDRVVWDAPLQRVNGVLFLEPSMFSLFLGLAVVIALHRRRSPLLVLLLLAAIVPTVAGNGLVVVAAGAIALAVAGRWRQLAVLALPAAAVALVAATLPTASRLVQRGAEIGSPGSSAALRMVQPYLTLTPAWLHDPWSVLVGAGAGSATELVARSGQVGLLPPLVPKVLYEYGALAGLLLLLFLGAGLFLGARPSPWAPGLVLAYAVVNAGLLQATLAMTAVLFVRLLQGPTAPEPGETHDLAPDSDLVPDLDLAPDLAPDLDRSSGPGETPDLAPDLDLEGIRR